MALAIKRRCCSPVIEFSSNEEGISQPRCCIRTPLTPDCSQRQVRGIPANSGSIDKSAQASFYPRYPAAQQPSLDGPESPFGMRLINVETWKLEYFLGDAIPPYAILSHTWGNDADELTFRDVHDSVLDETRDARKLVKLKGSCQQAKKDKLGYVWIDTCCIDKADSVELGEAINSMFQWYNKASECYVYLSDVPAGERDVSREHGSKFFSSRWFQRGWTLQELLAPKRLRFYDQGWELLGTKGQMAGAIEQITGIPRAFLLGWLGLHEASVAQRMSWAAGRVTKRKEDIAYSLLGIFGVMMPMIYGEGNQAFFRLQEAIMGGVRDDSILAWGFGMQPDELETSKGALAISPSDFAGCKNIVSRQWHSPFLDIMAGGLRVNLYVCAAPRGPSVEIGDYCGFSAADRKTARVLWCGFL